MFAISQSKKATQHINRMDEVWRRVQFPSVLVAEDEQEDRYVITQALQMLGFDQVREAMDGADAIKSIEHNAPAVLILDMNMPKMSGLDVLRWMDGRKMLDSVRTIIITGDVGGPLVGAALRDHGPQTVIAKPFSLVHFERALNNILPVQLHGH